MRASVNSNCIACGLCEEVCPEVFRIGESGFAQAEGEVPSALEGQAREARDGCPVAAIDLD